MRPTLSAALVTAILLSFSGSAMADTKTYSNGARYDGPMVLRKPHGVGTMHLPGGGSYVGGFVNGELTGHGRIVDGQGFKTYEGQFVNGYRHGSGKAWHLNGDYYEGQYKDDKRHGEGALLYSDGTRYFGQFVEGAVTGKGRLIKTDGTVYEGMWENSTYLGPAQ